MKWLLLALLASSIAANAADSIPVSQPTVSQLTGRFRGGALGCMINLELKENGDYKATWNGCLGEYGDAKGTWTVSGTVITLNPVNESRSLIGHLHLLNIIKKKGDFVFAPDLSDKTCFNYSDGDSVLHRLKPVPITEAVSIAPPGPPLKKYITTAKKTTILKKKRVKLNCNLFPFDQKNAKVICEVDSDMEVFIEEQRVEVKDGKAERYLAYDVWESPRSVVRIRAIDRHGTEITQTLKVYIDYQ